MLYILRHGKTDWNERHMLQGQVDIPLNAEGRQMARDAARKYNDIHLDVCYSSPLSRARETADIFLSLRESAVPVIEDNRLKEMSFGDYEGVEDIRNKPECPVYKLFEEPQNYVAMDNAESYESLYGRTGSFIEEVIKPQLSSGKDILIVGHGAMNCSIVNQLCNIPIDDFWHSMLGNCELMKVEKLES